MDSFQNTQPTNPAEEHIVSFRDSFSIWISLILLTALTVSIAVFSASLVSLTTVTALTIATAKALVVAYYFMHLKYDKAIYRRLIYILLLVYISLLVLTIVDYVNR